MTNSQATTENTYRWYIRCKDCLSVSVLELPTRDTYSARRALEPMCCICAGHLEPMGYVEGASIITRDAEVCACDERCTDARGPHCSCACGGKNHGAGMSATVHVTERNAIPIVTPPGDAAKLAARAREYREANTAALARIEGSPQYPTYQAKLTGQWIDRFSYYCTVRDWYRALQDAQRARTHSGRIKKLATIAKAPEAPHA